MKRSLPFFFALACCACVGVRGDKLPRLDRSELATEARLPAITYQSISGTPARGQTQHNSWPAPETEALFCSAFVDARPAPASDTLHVELSFRTKTINRIVSKGSFLLMIFSLGVLPAYVTVEQSLGAHVELQGKTLHEYQYVDQSSTWCELLLIPWGFSHSPFTVRREVFENMLLHFLRDLRRDLPQPVPSS